MTDDNHQSSISTFFHGKSVLITGATGFVGKQIIEKLLRSCAGIDRVYILIRSKRGVDGKERLRHLCALPLFDRLRILNPNFASKIIPIIGDLTKINLDLTKEDEEILIENCHVVINSGACVRFDDPLKQTIRSNVYSVQNMIHLGRKIKHLQSFVHISTAYIHCYRTVIDEMIYPMNEDPTVLLESLDYFDQKIFDHLEKKILEKYPNAYTYSKSLAEYLLLQQGHDLPIAIVRPSIIGASWKEPIPGWIDGYAGATGVIIAVGKRLLRIGLVRPMVDHPTIPVDTVVNMTIAIAWWTAIKKNGFSSTLPVYNCCTGTNTKTCLSQEGFVRTMLNEEKAIGFEDYRLINPSLILTMNRPYYYVRRFVEEILPAYLIDFIARLTWRKARMVKFYRKVNSLKLSMEYFCQNQWIFPNHNSQLLQHEMNDFDRQEFNFDLTGLNWSSYLRNYCLGIKKYLLKEELQASSKHSSIKRFFLQRIRRVLSILFFFTVTWLLRRIFLKKLRSFWQTFKRSLRTDFSSDQTKIFYSLK